MTPGAARGAVLLLASAALAGGAALHGPGPAPAGASVGGAGGTKGDGPPPRGARSADGPAPGAVRAGFAVAFREHEVPYRVFLLTALPGEEVEIEARPGPDGSAGEPPRFRLRSSAGSVVRTGPRAWSWSAPEEPGAHRLVVRRTTGPGSGRGDAAAGRPAAADSIVLNALVLVPFPRLEDGRVDGYRIGTYPAEPYRNLARYRRPRGFIRLTRELADLRVSPHYTLGQFPTRRPRIWPKYLVLNERLLLKLELLMERAARQGVPTTGWRVLSGYRSPWYNADIGRPRYSRHIYGDAADVYVDRDGDGVMDDIDGDGRVAVGDADLLYEIVQRMDGRRGLRHLLGGLGKYPTTSNHGPFVHVDTRGYRARW